MFPVESEKTQREYQDRRGARPGQQGQPAFVATDEMRANVKAWIKVTSADVIALKLGISRDTLDRHFKAELSDGRFEAVSHIGGKLIQKAMGGNMTAMIFYLRTQGKWNTRIEHTGLDGGPISTFDAGSFLASLPLDEQKLMRPLIEKMLLAAGLDPDGENAPDAAG